MILQHMVVSGHQILWNCVGATTVGGQALPHCVEGQVSAIGQNGSLVTNIREEQLSGAPRDDRISVQFAGHQTFGLFDLSHDQPESTMVAKLGDTGTVEIEIVGLSLSELLGIKMGESVKIRW